jgi:uncharacterized protein (TIGR03083 family)
VVAGTDTRASVDACLRALDEASNALVTEIAYLSPAEWDAPSNCPPWRVRDIAVHLVTSGERFIVQVCRGLDGSVEPVAVDESRQRYLEASDPTGIAAALDTITPDFARLYAGLDEEQLALVCFHRRGNRSVAWYAFHRLAEVAFHGWDVHTSLGRDAELDEAIARLLLPTLLESNAPRMYAAGLSAERGRGERILLVTDREPAAAWLVTIGPDAMAVTRGFEPADLTITGPAAALAPLAYGRGRLPDLEASGAVRVAGDRALVDRFALVFPRP